MLSIVSRIFSQAGKFVLTRRRRGVGEFCVTVAEFTAFWLSLGLLEEQEPQQSNVRIA